MSPCQSTASNPHLQACTELLSRYATRGFFNGFSPLQETSSRASYQLHWHFNRLYQLEVNLKTHKIQMPVIFANVKARSPMDKDFRAFIHESSSPDQPQHRRFDTEALTVINRSGNLSLSMRLSPTATPPETAQAVTRFVSLIHEVFKVFLKNGHYDTYVSEQYQIDADSFW